MYRSSVVSLTELCLSFPQWFLLMFPDSSTNFIKLLLTKYRVSFWGTLLIPYIINHLLAIDVFDLIIYILSADHRFNEILECVGAFCKLIVHNCRFTKYFITLEIAECISDNLLISFSGLNCTSNSAADLNTFKNVLTS